tara:strand:+ start:392 stop:688 length:297 start_codon:yes stop_codon:yes gene_type:complete
MEFKKSKKKNEFKINGLIDDEKILWKKIPCCCNKSDILKSFPISECIHCYCQRSIDSMPRKPFEIILTDKKGKKETKTITEITIDRGDKYQEVRGWAW